MDQELSGSFTDKQTFYIHFYMQCTHIVTTGYRLITESAPTVVIQCTECTDSLQTKYSYYAVLPQLWWPPRKR